MKCKHKYADGGKIVAPKQEPKKMPTSMLGKGAAKKAADSMLTTRQKQMKDLGL